MQLILTTYVMATLDDYFKKVDEYVATAEHIVGDLRGQLVAATENSQRILAMSQKVEKAVGVGTATKRLELLRFVTSIVEKDSGAADIEKFRGYEKWLRDQENDSPSPDDAKWVEILAQYDDIRRRHYTLIGGIGRIYLKLYDPSGATVEALKWDQENIVLNALVEDRGPGKSPKDHGKEASFINDFTGILPMGVPVEEFSDKLLGESVKELLSIPKKTAVCLAYGHSGSGKTFSMGQLYQSLDVRLAGQIKGVRAFQFYDDTMREPKLCPVIGETYPEICEKVIPLNVKSKNGAPYPSAENPFPLKKYDVLQGATIPEYPLHFGADANYKGVRVGNPTPYTLSYVKKHWESTGYVRRPMKFTFRHDIQFVRGEFNRFNTTRIYDVLAFIATNDGEVIKIDREQNNFQDTVPYLSINNVAEKPNTAGENNYNNYKCFDHLEWKFPNYFVEEEASIGSTYRHNFSEIPFVDMPEGQTLATLIVKVNKARFTRSTISNDDSSRSQLAVEILLKNGSTLIMLDLAGNENTRGSSTYGQITFYEAHFINYTLAKIQETTLAIMHEKAVAPALDMFGKYLNSIQAKKPIMTFLVCAHGKYLPGEYVKAAITHQAIKDTLEFVANIYGKERKDAAAIAEKAEKEKLDQLAPETVDKPAIQPPAAVTQITEEERKTIEKDKLQKKVDELQKTQLSKQNILLDANSKQTMKKQIISDLENQIEHIKKLEAEIKKNPIDEKYKEELKGQNSQSLREARQAKQNELVTEKRKLLQLEGNTRTAQKEFDTVTASLQKIEAKLSQLSGGNRTKLRKRIKRTHRRKTRTRLRYR